LVRIYSSGRVKAGSTEIVAFSRAFAIEERAQKPGVSGKGRLKQECQWYWLF